MRCLILALLVGACSAGTAHAQSRFPVMASEQMSAEQRAATTVLIQNGVSIAPDKTLAGPLVPWIRSPRSAIGLQAAIATVIHDSSLPERLIQLAIMLSAKHWESDYIWSAHQPKALKAGLPQSTLDAIRKGRRPAGMSAKDAAVFDIDSKLWTKKRVDDATFARAKSALGEQGLIDLVAVLGLSDTVARTMNLADVTAPLSAARPAPGRAH